ncbi:hypothetical protein PQQ51_31060 [Paraburkholderia xenovorans]|uniref:hypothetical protein n=1 Tax=Paraburkholderia xenovorans TaxID=36873 RepID=UPI0038B72D48
MGQSIVKVESLNRQHALAQIRRSLQFSGAEETLLAAIASEHIRAMASVASQQGRPIATATITRCVTPRIAPLWDIPQNDTAAIKEFVRSELACLAEMGEIQALPNGHWSSTPLRSVVVKDGVSLLLGGGPVLTLPQSLRKSVLVSGRTRILMLPTELTNSEKMPIRQRLSDWLHLPHENVRKWAAEFLKSRVTALVSAEEVEGAQVHFRGYWRSAPYQGCEDGVYLTRRRVSMPRGMMFLYSISRVKASGNGGVSIQADFPIEKDDALRLQSGLKPVHLPREKFQCEVSGNTLTVTLPRPLPWPERRVFALGWLVPNESGQGRYPKRFLLHPRLRPLVERTLSELNIELVDKQPSGEPDEQERRI